MPHSETRFYEQSFPEPNDLVMVKVARLEQNMGAYVHLLEYGRMEGLILPSELSKRRFRSISKLIRVGRQEVAMVVRVDTEKGYVDLSKKRVAPEDIAVTEDRFSKSKKCYLTARQVASQLEMDIEELNRIAIWPLYAKHGHAYNGLKEAVENPESAFAGIDCPPAVIAALVEDMKTRLTPQALRVRTRILVSCSGQEGVVAVRRALLAAEQLFRTPKTAEEDAPPPPASTGKHFELKVLLVASPLYTVMASCFDKAEGIRKTEEALKVIQQTICATPGGEFRRQGEIVVYGADDAPAEKSEDEEESSSSDEEEESEDDSSEEDEGMGQADTESEHSGGDEERQQSSKQIDRKI